MRTFLRGKVRLLFVAFAVMLAVPAVALADNLIDTLDGGAATQTIAAGGTFTNDYWIVANDSAGSPQGCDVGIANDNITATFSWPATGAGSLPAGVSASPSSITFDECQNGPDKNAQSVTFTSNQGGTYTIPAPTKSGGTGSYNTNPSSFTLVVTGSSSSNQAPTANAGGSYAFDEGSATNALNGSDSSDPDGDPLTYSWDLNYDGTNFTEDSTDEDPNFDATNIDGPATRTVALKVTDDNGAESAIDTAAVTIDNVAPTASNGSFVLNPVLGTATAGFSFSDASTLDTHGPNLSYFTWSGVGDTGNRMATVTETNGSGTASDSRTLATGCYPNLGVTGTAVDDDSGASDPLSIYSASSTTPASVYSKAFRPPIQDNERNIAKFGNVVPVKVLLTNPCTGTTVTNKSLYITLAKGLNGEFIEDSNVVAESVSAADTGTQMRIADGGYIYNLSTKNLSANTDWAVRVRLGAADGPIILQAVLYPKK